MAIWPDKWRLSKQPGYHAKSLKQTIIGWKHPLRGVWVAFLAEGSLRFEVYSLLAIIGLGIWRDFSYLNWALVLIGSTLVLSFEFSNTTHEMSQRLANPRRYVRRRVLVEPPKPPPLTRLQRYFWQKLGIPPWPEPPAESADEYTYEDVPQDQEAVRNIYDVAASQVTWPLVLTVFFVVHAVIWPR